MTQNSIGQFLCALRKANGLTQQDVADHLCVSNKAISRWERDECMPDISLIPAIAEFYHVTCDELLKGEKVPTAEPDAEKKEVHAEKRRDALLARARASLTVKLWITAAISLCGYVIMLLVSFGWYRPPIGFFMQMLFSIAAFTVIAIAVARAFATGKNELFSGQEGLSARFLYDVGTRTHFSFFIIFALAFAAWPLLNNPTEQVYYSMFAGDYISVLLRFVLPVSILLYLLSRPLYLVFFGHRPDRQAVCMDAIQIGAVFLAGFLFDLCWLEMLEAAFVPWDCLVCIIAACIFLLGNILCFVLFFVRAKGERNLLLPGLRNIALIPLSILFVAWDINGYLDTDMVANTCNYAAYVGLIAFLLSVLLDKKKHR